MASTFHPFPALPLKTRLQIWELTFIPRVIPFNPDRTFMSLAQDHIPSLGTLSACRESRDLALDKGYRVWSHLNNDNSLMWNPTLDTILQQDLNPMIPNMTQVISQEFPEEMKAIQYMALPSSCWNIATLMEIDPNKWRWESLPLVSFESLKEITFVVNLRLEIQQVNLHKTDTLASFSGWGFPETIENRLERLRSQHSLDWNKSAVRMVVGNEEIFSKESRVLELRFYPCPDLHEVFDQRNVGRGDPCVCCHDVRVGPS